MIAITRSIVLIALLSLAESTFAMQLVTPEEVMASRNAPPIQEASSDPADPMAPQITVVAPDSIDKAIKNPFKMEVLFKSKDGAVVDFKSFQAFYGLLKLDITSRLMQEAEKTSTGIKLSNVNVPSGSHRILLRIKDSQNRLAEKQISFKVE
jgi:hypothetical protein